MTASKNEQQNSIFQKLFWQSNDLLQQIYM